MDTYTCIIGFTCIILALANPSMKHLGELDYTATKQTDRQMW